MANSTLWKEFKHAVVAVDVVIFTIADDELQVLLLDLKDEPFSDSWALPGGLVKVNENLEDAVERHLETKTNVSRVYTEQLYTFGEVDRDPRGRVVSVAYMALLPTSKYELKTSDRYKAISWHPVDELPKLAYDHKSIIKAARSRLISKLSYTNIAYSLLPSEFSLSELQNVYELIIGQELDKRNFRKKILSLDVIKNLNKKRKGTQGRPAQLFSFKEQKLREYPIF